jgi:hypothetical protein
MFYKYENESLMSGPTVAFPEGEVLHLELLDTYTFPINGWYYFATEEEAKAFYNIND